MNEQSRDDLVELFTHPPLEYSDFLTYFWECGKLTKEQLTWQLEQLREKGVGGTWYYPRYVRGEPYGANPPYWSEGWWEMFEHYVAEHERLGMTVWFAEWTGQQGWQDQMRGEMANNPEMQGHRLAVHEAEAGSGDEVEIEIPVAEHILDASAFPRVDGNRHGRRLDGAARVDLRGSLKQGKLSWTAPSGLWIVIVVTAQHHDLNYLNPSVAKRWLELYFQPHVERLKPFVGKALQGYLQDEIYVLNGNIAWDESLLTRFRAKKGYDPRPYLAGLFFDIGDATDKIRCEYYDVMSTMLEENFYRPLSDWHEERGLLFSTIATWGRQDILGQTYHYGDFFRLCRWFHITGNEDPGSTEPGGRCLTDAKFSSSILHLYERKRAAMCVYWGSGHGMTQEQNLAWTNENFSFGLNMYNTHGGLYGSLGSWYEWVPPSVHFRQPYYELWKPFVDYISRLSAVLSQGRHRADVALLYPLSSIHANWFGGDRFTAAADEIGVETLTLAKGLFTAGIDFDFINEEKLLEAEFREGKLQIAGVEFSSVVLPPMTTVRADTLVKLRDFVRAGGIVLAFRDLPTASVETGRNDERVRGLLQEIFGFYSSAEYTHSTRLPNRHVTASAGVCVHESGGRAVFVPGHEVHRNNWYHPGLERPSNTLPYLISEHLDLDVVCSGQDVYHTHKKIGDLDAYFLYNVRSERRSLEFTFRVEGDPEIWDAFSGRRVRHHRFDRGRDTTQVRLEMERNQGILLVFSAGRDRPAVVEDDLISIRTVEEKQDSILVEGVRAEGGRCRVRVLHGEREYVGECRVQSAPDPVPLPREWDFELQPTLDNRWGDYRYPASQTLLGPEARLFKYRPEGEQPGIELGWCDADFDDADWPELAYSFGPYWLNLGPFDAALEPDELDRLIRGEIDADSACRVAGTSYEWKEHFYSQTVGHADKQVYLASGGVHGVDERFIYFPATGTEQNLARYLVTWVCVKEPRDWDFHFGSGRPAGDSEQAQFETSWEYNLGEGSGAGQRAWVNGRQVANLTADKSAAVRVRLEKGKNPVVLKLIHHNGQPITVFGAFVDPEQPLSGELPPPPRLKWFSLPSTPIYDIAPGETGQVGWYRFEAPSGTRRMKLTTEAQEVQAWVNEEQAEIRKGFIELPSAIQGVAQVALRIRQRPGRYAGAAIPEPVEFHCEPTRMPLGDWTAHALDSYSGGALYRSQFELSEDHLAHEIELDLGKVHVAAEVQINERTVGVGLARPFRFDITDYCRWGSNRIVVRVFNTLANHYAVAFPSSHVFEGQTISGLLGPVEVRFFSRVRIIAKATAAD